MATLLQKATQHLQTQGGRMTAQRRLILETIQSLSGHPTAEEIHCQAARRDSSLNLSTVYRTLRWLETQQLVSPRWFEEKRMQGRFDPNLPTDHHHFRCQRCNRIIEFNDPRIEAIMADFAARQGARVEQASLVFYGICADCLCESQA